MDIRFGPISNAPDAAPGLPGTALQQHPLYAQTLARLGVACMVADITDGGQSIGRAQIFNRRFGPLRAAWVPRWPVWVPDIPHNLRRAAVAHLPRAAPWGALWARMPDHGHAPGLRVAAAPLVAELDLTPDSATRRAAQHGKWRNRLRRAEGAGLHVSLRALDLPVDATLLMQELTQRRARRYAGLPARFTEGWPPGQTLLATAHSAPDTAPLAFMLFLLHAPTATYHMGWSSDQGRTVNAHTLLLWRAADHLATQGFERLDLGLTDPARTPGLARFKQGSGAKIRRLGATTLTARLL
ncbi:GNAT family N-acetyltransferase [Rhodobacteraceae bacterium KMM 6894]|nr:GNAT family N-acetyltransferase [Rhodobacteraceae bacterium KMM 6894]